jgi:hypothetical protein
MSSKQVFVDCVRDGQAIASYSFGYAETLGPSVPPSHPSLVAEAKTNLTNQAIAYPPYAGVEFRARWS